MTFYVCERGEKLSYYDKTALFLHRKSESAGYVKVKLIAGPLITIGENVFFDFLAQKTKEKQHKRKAKSVSR